MICDGTLKRRMVKTLVAEGLVEEDAVPIAGSLLDEVAAYLHEQDREGPPGNVVPYGALAHAFGLEAQR